MGLNVKIYNYFRSFKSASICVTVQLHKGKVHNQLCATSDA